MENLDLKELIDKFRQGTISQVELQVLKQCVIEKSSEEILDAYAQEEYQKKEQVFDPTVEHIDRAFSDTWSKIKEDVITPHTKRNSNWIKLISTSAAAMILICFYLYYREVIIDDPQDLVGHDKNIIVPGGPRAKLVLDDGSTIDLEKLKEDTTILMGGYAIQKNKEGNISYEIIADNTPSTTMYNTIITPKGGEYKLNLADGSTIWVNASSTLRYPLNFSDNSRLVELAGEAYFEVTKLKNTSGKSIPFFVHTGEQILEVLGTSFNINSYNKSVATTLVEGKVRLQFPNGKTRTLAPSQQSIYDEYSQKVYVKQIDPFYVTAWKNGSFAFENTPITQVTEYLARWYDVVFLYNSDITNLKFTGTISKYEDIKKILKVIEETGTVKFKIEGRRIQVM